MGREPFSPEIDLPMTPRGRCGAISQKSPFACTPTQTLYTTRQCTDCKCRTNENFRGTEIAQCVNGSLIVTIKTHGEREFLRCIVVQIARRSLLDAEPIRQLAGKSKLAAKTDSLNAALKRLIIPYAAAL